MLQNQCQKCGHTNRSTSKYCMRCGNTLAYPITNAITSLPSGPALCPTCRLQDKVVKVSAIINKERRKVTDIESQTFTEVDNKGNIRYGTYEVPVIRNEETERYSFLAPPTEPQLNGGLGCLLPVLNVVLVSALAAGVLFTTYFLYQLQVNTEPLFQGRTVTQSGNLIIMFGLMGVVCFIIGLVGLFKANLTERRNKRRYLTEYNQEKAVWDRAMKVWNRLYYCERDDVIFDPSTGRTCTIQQVKDFIVSNP